MMTITHKKHLISLSFVICYLSFSIALLGCSDAWDDHFSPDVEQGGQSLWETTLNNPELTNFASVVRATGYDLSLDGGQTFSVFAPLNSYFSTAEAETLITQYNAEKVAGTKDEENSVVKEFLQNHIALYGHCVSSLTNDSLKMMNGKYQMLTASTFAGRSLQQGNISCKNGVLYTIDGQAEYFPNVFEYIRKDTELDSLATFVYSFNNYVLNAAKSVPGDIVDGKTQYLHTVYNLENELLRLYLGPINAEDSAYLLLTPTNEVWQQRVPLYEQYFQYDNAVGSKHDSLTWVNARMALIRGTVFNLTQNSEAALQDSAFSTEAVPYQMRKQAWGSEAIKYYQYSHPWAEGGAFSGTTDIACSNGRVLKAGVWNIDPRQTFMQTIIVEGESGARLDSVDLTTTVYPAAIGRVSASNPFYGQISGNAYVEIAPVSRTQTKAYFSLPNLLSNVGYDIYLYTAPAISGDENASDAQRLPTKFKASLRYQRADGSLPTEEKNWLPLDGSSNTGNAEWTTTPDVIDTFKIATDVKIPFTTYGSGQGAKVELIFQSTPTTREVNRGLFNRILRIDRIVVVPHTNEASLPVGGLLLCLLLMFSSAVKAQEGNGEPTTKPRHETPTRKQYATRKVSGRVVDAATLQALPGAIVKAQGVEGYSAMTAEDGSFTMNVPTFTSALLVSRTQYNPATVGLDAAERQVDIRMESNIMNASHEYSPAINIKEEVQKQHGAEAYTTERSGMPGIGANIFIQGLNSLNANAQPLVVVDGVIFDQQYGRSLIHSGFYNDILSAINPADIEKVEIVRNGTALYGAKGAAGVIIITTKRSQSMATRITASLSAGVTMQPRHSSMMGASDYRIYASELLGTTGTTATDFRFLNENPDYYYYPQYHNETDWKKEVYRTAMTQNYGISVEGGDNIASYKLSLGYTNAQSTLKYNDMNRLNVRFNTDINILPQLAVRFDASFSNTTRDLRDDGAPAGYDDGTPTSPAFLANVKAPFISPYSYGAGQLSDTKLDIEDEAYLSEALSDYTSYNWRLSNPWALNEYAEAENKNRFENSMLNLSVTPTWKIRNNLSLSEHFSYNLVNTNEKYYIPVNGVPDYFVAAVNAFRENEVRSLFSKQNSVMSDTRLRWQQRYGAHELSANGGVRINWETYKLEQQLGYNTGSDKTPFMSSSLLNASSTGTNDEWTNIAWYAKADYDYLGRYFLDASLTAETSSRFGNDADGGLKMAGVTWGVFPSLQASWVVTNEPWFHARNAISHLRLTAGYDISGNDDIDLYAARSYMTSKLYLAAVSGISLEGIGNTRIKWETTRRFNVGFDSQLFAGRLILAFRYFHSNTYDLLAMQTLGYLSGLTNNWSNGGRLQNDGFDVSAAVKAVNLRNFKWEIGASLGHYKNKITELPDGADFIDNTYYGATIRSQVGQAANLFYGYRTEGVFATSEETQAAALYILADNGITKNYFGAGDMRFADLNGDHRIDDNDRVVIGDPNPDIYGNIFTTLAYKRLKLDVSLNYCLGNDVYNYQRSQLEGGCRFMNQTTNLLARWSMEGQQTNVPRATFQDPMGNSRFSDRWIEDGSYLRLKSVTLSYDLPMNTTFIQGLQFWIQGNNLLTFSKYLGADPECSSTSAVIGQGVDLGLLGQSRSVVAGIKINL